MPCFGARRLPKGKVLDLGGDFDVNNGEDSEQVFIERWVNTCSERLGLSDLFFANAKWRHAIRQTAFIDKLMFQRRAEV